MKTLIKLSFGLCLLTFLACSKDEDPIIAEAIINPIRMEIQEVITENNIVEIWGVNAETCAATTWYDGTDDFEFKEHFLRIKDKYFRYESLVSFEIDKSAGGNQMLLCFN